MKLVCLLLCLALSFSVMASFEGEWSSETVSVKTPVHEGSGCQSTFTISISEARLHLSNPIVINCNGFGYFTQTAPMDIAADGRLSSRNGAHGRISDELIEIFSPLMTPEGTFIWSHATLTKTLNDKMMVKLGYEIAGGTFSIEGEFSKN